MKNEEAIEILQEERDYAQFPKYVREAIKIAISAIERQIPKKPKNYTIDCHGYMIYDCECPNCKTEHKEMYAFAYCPHCGQKIDWQEVSQ